LEGKEEDDPASVKLSRRDCCQVFHCLSDSDVPGTLLFQTDDDVKDLLLEVVVVVVVVANAANELEHNVGDNCWFTLDVTVVTMGRRHKVSNILCLLSAVRKDNCVRRLVMLAKGKEDMIENLI